MMNDNHNTEGQVVEISNVTEDESSRDDTPTRTGTIPQKIVTGLHFEDKSEPEEVLPLYERNEKVYAADECGDIYVATIKQIKIESGNLNPSWKYLVHFKGWNSRHDRWLLASDILPDNKESQHLAEQSKLKAKEIERKRKEKKSTIENEKKRKLERRQLELGAKTGTEDIPVQGGKKQKRGRPAETKRMMHECCTLPFSLQQVMVDEQSELTSLDLGKSISIAAGTTSTSARRVHDLPASITVERILKQFAKSCLKNQKGKEGTSTLAEPSRSGEKSDIEMKYKSFMKGMMKMFDHMLPKYLLYNYERGQYLKLCTGKKGQDAEAPGGEKDLKLSVSISMPSAVYSGEFLLRMLARLPYLLSAIHETASSCKSREGNDCSIFLRWNVEYQNESSDTAILIRELILFLQKNREKIFKGKYVYANLE